MFKAQGGSHNDETHLTRARKPSVLIVTVQTETYVGVSIRLRRYSQSAKPNCSTVTTGNRQSPGSGAVMCYVSITLYLYIFTQSANL